MESKDFEQLLKEARITKAALAREVGITPSHVSKWRIKTPAWVIAYLELRAKYQRLLDKL